MTNLISVIVPIYNVEKYLYNCVDSIIRQTYSNLEIILVDDGSPDKCGEICDYFASIDSRVKVIKKKNGGLSDARNAGIKVASGDFISFIDSDDMIHENFFEILMNIIISSNADIAQCGFIKVYEDDSKQLNNKKNIDIDRYTECEFSNIEALQNLYIDSYVSSVISCNKLYRKSLFKDIRFPYGKLHEDEFTTYRVFYSAKKIVITKAPLYFYLQRNNSITGSKFNLKKLDILEAYADQILFFNEKELKHLENEAMKRLEYLLRLYIKEVINSAIVNKNEILNSLKRTYRNQYFYKYFKKQQKVKTLIFHFIPLVFMKSLFSLLDIRRTLKKS